MRKFVDGLKTGFTVAIKCPLNVYANNYGGMLNGIVMIIAENVSFWIMVALIYQGEILGGLLCGLVFFASGVVMLINCKKTYQTIQDTVQEGLSPLYFKYF